jgi:periplasmic divalent cation tolerance protein
VRVPPFEAVEARGSFRAAMDTLIVLSTLPDRAGALALAGALLERRLAACVNVLAECTSVYRWQGKVETAAEVPILIKTTAERYAALEQAIRELHPYELPEIVAVPIRGGLPGYLQWVADETRSDSTP